MEHHQEHREHAVRVSPAAEETACEPADASTMGEFGAGVDNHPECVSHAADGAEISKFGWGGARQNSGGARPGAGRKPRTVAKPAMREAGPRWYVLQTEPRREFQVIHDLTLAGFTVRMPMFIDNAHPVSHPLWPGYVFVQFDVGADDWRFVVHRPFVTRLFGADRELPTPLPIGWLETVLAMENDDGLIDARAPVPAIQPGTLLRVTDGPFTSFVGVCAWSDDERVRAVLNIFGRDAPVDLPRSSIEPA